MANGLLATRDAGRVGVNWASTFVERHLEITTLLVRNVAIRELCAEAQKLSIFGSCLFET